MSANWLQTYLVEAVGRGVCTKIGCTTCGANDFRQGLLGALAEFNGLGGAEHLNRKGVIEIAHTLAEVAPGGPDRPRLASAVRCLLVDLWSGLPLLDTEIEAILGKSWAGELLQEMKEHERNREAQRRAHAETQDPVNVRKRREEKKRLKQEHHERRLAEKKERDRVWRAEHPSE